MICCGYSCMAVVSISLSAVHLTVEWFVYRIISRFPNEGTSITRHVRKAFCGCCIIASVLFIMEFILWVFGYRFKRKHFLDVKDGVKDNGRILKLYVPNVLLLLKCGCCELPLSALLLYFLSYDGCNASQLRLLDTENPAILIASLTAVVSGVRYATFVLISIFHRSRDRSDLCMTCRLLLLAVVAASLCLASVNGLNLAAERLPISRHITSYRLFDGARQRRYFRTTRLGLIAAEAGGRSVVGGIGIDGPLCTDVSLRQLVVEGTSIVSWPCEQLSEKAESVDDTLAQWTGSLEYTTTHEGTVSDIWSDITGNASSCSLTFRLHYRGDAVLYSLAYRIHRRLPFGEVGDCVTLPYEAGPPITVILCTSPANEYDFRNNDTTGSPTRGDNSSKNCRPVIMEDSDKFDACKNFSVPTLIPVNH